MFKQFQESVSSSATTENIVAITHLLLESIIGTLTLHLFTFGMA